MEDGGALAETHRAAHFRLVDLRHVHDHGLFTLLVEFGAAGLVHAADVAGEFDDGELHAETDTEVGDVVGAGPLRALDHSFCAALAETALFLLVGLGCLEESDVPVRGYRWRL